jgi:formylglycine-generating enzyme required for sulfatase activity
MAAPTAQLCWSATTKRESTCAVATFPAGDTPEGVHDLAGNVWEWTATRLDGKHPVDKGGSWDESDPAMVRATNQDEAEPTFRAQNLGFRCAK